MEGPDQRWTAALDAVGAVSGDRDAAFAALAAAHEGPGRCYHTFAHASAVVDGVLSLLSDGDAWGPPVLAAWFHDAVYDATAARGVNEGASAVLAARTLTDLGATLTAVGEVVRLVVATVDHRVRTGDRGGGLLCDADLAVFAADGDAYDAYVAGIRREYAHVSDDEWRAGRARVLRSFLDRDAIYRTPAASERWEARARINISDELGRLSR